MRIDEFLLARIAEVETAARRALATESLFVSDGCTVEWAWAHLATHPSGGSGRGFAEGAPTPARVLAECEAKRRIVAEAADIENSHCGCLGLPGEPILRALAQPYADHPDFDPAWAR